MKIIKEGILPIKECNFCDTVLEYDKNDIKNISWDEFDGCLTIFRHSYYIICPTCSSVVNLSRDEVNGIK